MGRFLNPDNSAFQKILNSEIYVDKSQLISYTNRMINAEQAFMQQPAAPLSENLHQANVLPPITARLSQKNCFRA